MCASCHSILPLDYESVRTVSIFDLFTLHFLTDIFKYYNNQNPIISPRIILCSGIHTNNEITKPNETRYERMETAE